MPCRFNKDMLGEVPIEGGFVVLESDKFATEVGQGGITVDNGRCCMMQLRREWGRFSNFSFRAPQRRISAYPTRPSG